MGCVLSASIDGVATKKKPGHVGEVVVFVPGLRIPKSMDFGRLLNGYSSAIMVERLSALRTRIVVMAAEEGPTVAKTKRKAATQHGGSTLADLQQALEDYLPVLLGLAHEGNLIAALKKGNDFSEETALSSTWYEVLSVLHIMAMISLSQANSLLLPKAPVDGHQPKVSEENKKTAIEMLLKSAGYLEYGVRHILTQIPEEIKYAIANMSQCALFSHLRKLPTDLQEGVLQAISVQALGQGHVPKDDMNIYYILGKNTKALYYESMESGQSMGVEIQLGMAIDSVKATLAVKRRLACEQVKYWRQAQYCISNALLGNGWGQKHFLFIKWKYTEAKAAAYYYHGLILDESIEENGHAKALACLQTAEQLLKESKTACINFCLASPVTRVPPVWGAMKYLSEKIPKDASSKARNNGDICNFGNLPDGVPKLPDFPVALKPDEYEMPPIDPSWIGKSGMHCLPISSSEERTRGCKLDTLQLDHIQNERRTLSVV
eukprot:Gb_12160 [translate_table: standard]